ncbi:hypothetical protein FB45DRAFT_1063083 [Roridomyces roridus]|uniref:Uncharacterized protein n=1 Tax=Roridomyces roridus TaxID=1738132 RepID=A0AAD7BE69_9AGAR|nr:hypothetical protein FB45DRAFT_1063083 [Roridomyces roridus]
MHPVQILSFLLGLLLCTTILDESLPSHLFTRSISAAQNLLSALPLPQDIFSALALTWAVVINPASHSPPAELVFDSPGEVAAPFAPVAYPFSKPPNRDDNNRRLIYFALGLAVLIGLTIGALSVMCRDNSGPKPQRREQHARRVRAPRPLIQQAPHVLPAAPPILVDQQANPLPQVIPTITLNPPSSPPPRPHSPVVPISPADSHMSVIAQIFAGQPRNRGDTRPESSAVALERETRLAQGLGAFCILVQGWRALGTVARSAVVRRLIGEAGIFVTVMFMGADGRLDYPVAVVRTRFDDPAAQRALDAFEQLMGVYWEFTLLEQVAMIRHLLDGVPPIHAAGVSSGPTALPVGEQLQDATDGQRNEAVDGQQHVGQRRVPLRDIGGQGVTRTPCRVEAKHRREADENTPQPSGSRVDKGKGRAP